MARQLKTRGSAASAAPDRLAMSLHSAGMSALHRAGLGGLACTLAWIERAVEEGMLKPEAVPGGPWEGSPPWSIEPHGITLRFGEPDRAGDFLERLFRIAFDLRDGLIYLPGQYGSTPPDLVVRAYLQQGMTLSFLQHGKARKLGEPKQYEYRPEGEDGPPVTLSYRPCIAYKHQDGWKALARNGRLVTGPLEVVGPLNPGAVVRHVAFSNQTCVQEPAACILPLYFALVGCLALPTGRGSSGVLVIPEVDDLEQFIEVRPAMTPGSGRECQVAGPTDAVLQAQVRLRAKQFIAENDLPACHAMLFQPTQWSTQQKTRTRATSVPPGREVDLDRFAVALAELPPRLATGRDGAAFWADSVVRPLVADNLARSLPWYSNFTGLMLQQDPASRKPLRDRVRYEKKGLHAMIEKVSSDDEAETAVIHAVHEALRRRFGQIAGETAGSPHTMRNRFTGEYDRWRLAFAGAKTADQLRRALADLFSRGGVNSILQQKWQALLPMLREERWQQTRDLALLGLASYTGRGAAEIDVTKTGEEPDNDSHTPTP